MLLDDLKAQIFRDLEERLLRPEVRNSALLLDELLDDDFTEFGSSGRIYDKQVVIDSLLSESPTSSPPTLSGFKARLLAPDVALLTYRIVETNTLRSSIWKSSGGRWKLLFHQGTKIAD